MEKQENLQDILKQVNNVNDGINNMIIPILKDTINDGNNYNKRMFVLNIALSIILAIVILTAMFLIYRQNIKYQEFLNQFEFESEVYQETNNNSVINDGITITK